MQPSGKGAKEVSMFDKGHITKLAAMPVYSKNVKKVLLNYHWADCLTT